MICISFELYCITVCTRIQVDPHISRPSLLAVKKMSKIQDPRRVKDDPLVYHLPSDVADAINSVPCDAAVWKVREYCDEINRWSKQGASRRRAPTSNTATMTPYATCDVSHVPATPMSVICLAITQHGVHCIPLPPARSSCCSIKCHDVSLTHGADRRATGRSVLQSRAQLTSSALWKNS